MTINNNKIKTVNPATEQVIKEHEMMTEEQIQAAVRKAKNAFREWKKSEGASSKRSDFLHAFAAGLRKNKEKLARVATSEMGKAIRESRSEVEKCAMVMDYYADNDNIFTADELDNTNARKSFISFEPLGVIGSIMPLNFPYWQALRFAAPSLLVGNTIVLKPASATMQCGIEIENIFRETGLPDGVFQTPVGNSSIANTLIDSEISAVTFTGSVSAGAKVAQRATSQIKKCVLELGGSDPFIVCEYADVEKASSGAVKGRFINCGQSCITSKRFIVAKKVAKDFIEQFVQKTEKLAIGDPLSDNTDMGPLVNEAALTNIESLVKDAVKNGAQILTGGERLAHKTTHEGDKKGYFYKPTILEKITPKMRVAKEEVFGPVAPITVVENEMETIRVANDSEYGLGASIWTADLDNADKLSRTIEAGVVTVNNTVASDPRVPFGGVKKVGLAESFPDMGC
jgi:acyl-CoA reductase-like NAD-dependent aldehyde dehydrogenase